MDYKEKYEQLAKFIKDLYPHMSDYCKEKTEGMIPELKESEDEKVRKWLIEMVEEVRKANPTNADHNGNCSEAIAWLEKQGELKPASKMQVSEKLYEHIRNTCACIDDALSSKTLVDINDYLEQADADAQSAFDMIEKQIEQTPAWSEEDEIGLGNALWAIEQAKTIAKDENDMGNLWHAEKWLKFLRPQHHWKPSEEQVEALRVYLYHPQYINNSEDMKIKLVESLYADLQKLL